MSRPFNPAERCPSCGTSWGPADETCDHCGFDPVSNEEDAKFYDEAMELWLQMWKLQQPD